MENKPRYAIVRVDKLKHCPIYEGITGFCRNSGCDDCKMKENYGDAKAQLIRKIAQVMFRRKLKLYRKIWGSNMGSIERKDIYAQCLELAKEIVEFLGIEE